MNFNNCFFVLLLGLVTSACGVKGPPVNTSSIRFPSTQERIQNDYLEQSGQSKKDKKDKKEQSKK